MCIRDSSGSSNGEEGEHGIDATQLDLTQTQPAISSTSPTDRDKEVATAETTEKPRRKRRQRKKAPAIIAGKGKHNIFTHFPKCPNCVICQNNKAHRAYCKSGGDIRTDSLPSPTRFGEMITADHKIMNDDDASREEDRTACVIQDKWSYWLQAYPAPTKSTADTKRALCRFLGPGVTCRHIYTDNSKEFKLAAAELEIDQDTCTPHRSETNGMAENAVKRVKEGTSCSLSQSGFVYAWWDQAMACYCFHRNIKDVLGDNKTSYERRFGRSFQGPFIPFGAAVHYFPSYKKDKDRTHQLGEKTLDGIFLGYAQISGGGWNGDLLVIDAEELSTKDTIKSLTIKRFKADEVTAVKTNGDFFFPLIDGDQKQPEDEDMESYEKKAKRRQKERAQEAPEQEDQQQDESSVERNFEQNGLEPSDYWTVTSVLVIRHHRRPRTHLYVPSDSESPIPLKYIDVLRKTTTDLDDYKEKEIQDIWSLDKDKQLSGQWTGRTSFTILKSRPPHGYKWVDGRLTKIQKTKRPDSIRPEEWPHLSRKEQLKEIVLWQEEGPKRQKARDERNRHHIEDDEVEEYTKILAKAKEEFGVPAAAAMPC